MSPKPILSGTDLLHGDHEVPKGLEVSPAISVTTSKEVPPRKIVVSYSLPHLLQPSELLGPGVRKMDSRISILGTLRGMCTLAILKT